MIHIYIYIYLLNMCIYIYVGISISMLTHCHVLHSPRHQTILPMSHLRTVSDPEFPNDPEELLYFVLVELDIENIAELKRVTKLEMEGGLDADCLKAFVEARSARANNKHMTLPHCL